METPKQVLLGACIPHIVISRSCMVMRQLSQIGWFHEQLKLWMCQPVDMISAPGFHGGNSDGPCCRTQDIQTTCQTHKCCVAKLVSRPLESVPSKKHPKITSYESMEKLLFLEPPGMCGVIRALANTSHVLPSKRKKLPHRYTGFCMNLQYSSHHFQVFQLFGGLLGFYTSSAGPVRVRLHHVAMQSFH